MSIGQYRDGASARDCVLTVSGLKARFARQPAAVLDVASEIAARLAVSGRNIEAERLLAAARALLDRHPDPSALPLWGVPGVVGANIDVAGLVTSAGLPLLDFLPDADAPAVARLRAAGALIVDKASVDPLGFEDAASSTATAIVGGLAAFGLASDRTGAASLRAAGQGVVVVKSAPRRTDADSLFAVTPCHDSLAVIAADIDGAAAIRSGLGDVARRADVSFSRLGVLDLGRSSVPDAARRFAVVPVAADPFVRLASLMEDEVWLSRRLVDVEVAFAELPDRFPPLLRRRLAAAASLPARDLVTAERRLSTLRRQVEAALADTDFLLLPAEPRLAGFLNACHLSAVALPDETALAAPAGCEDRLMAVAAVLTEIPTSTGPIDIGASSPLAHP